MTTSDMARKIRALLDKAENTEYTYERDAFTAKAMSLMAAHQITEAMIDAAGNVEDRRGKLTERQILLGAGPYVRARLRLLDVVGKSNCCRLVTYVTFNGRVATLNGFESDIDRAEMLYTSLLVQAVNEANRMEIPSGLKTVAVRRSFLFGFATEVETRLRAARTEAATEFETEVSADSPSVALVLADRDAQVSDFMHRRYGKLHSLGASAPISTQGFAHGRAAGARANLGAGNITGKHGEIAS